MELMLGRIIDVFFCWIRELNLWSWKLKWNFLFYESEESGCGSEWNDDWNGSWSGSYL